VLRWGNSEDIVSVVEDCGEVDLVLAADCVYYEDALQDLARTLALLAASPHTEVLFRKGAKP